MRPSWQERPWVGMAELIECVQRDPAVYRAERSPDLAREALLAAETFPEGGRTSSANPQKILLTGAIGTYLLSDLLKETEALIYCLVRSSNEEEGYARIVQNLQAN